MDIAVEGNEILVTRPDDEKSPARLHGLTRTLIHNMVDGVTEGFTKELEVQRRRLPCAEAGQGPCDEPGLFPSGDRVRHRRHHDRGSQRPTRLSSHGTDKQKVGQFAAEVREKRPPEPYKGKGIKYAGEVIRRKEGKAGKGSSK